jgi:hypothetical protein
VSEPVASVPVTRSGRESRRLPATIPPTNGVGEDPAQFGCGADRPLVIACGALAGELRAVLESHGLAEQVEVRYLPAHLHNHPDDIVPAVEGLLDEAGERPAFVAYADCGTGGLLDALLVRHPGVGRLPGAHCYEVFAGPEQFAALHDEEPGTFFLTDFLARHFDALVWQGLGLDRHPQLRDVYFAHYRRVVLLSQSPDPAVVQAGRSAAARLDLEFEHRHVGRDRFAEAIPMTLAVK